MSRRPTVLLALLLLCALAVPARASSSWEWPLGDRRVSGTFDAPETPYGAGHRGIDLPGAVGDTVRSVAPGRVTFAGRVGGVPVVTVTHGAERSTYQPVRASVEVGDAVGAGQPLGRLLGRPSHCVTACLHLGRLRDTTYLDPQDVLAKGGRVHLVDPDGPPPVPPSLGTGELLRPVGGPVTSAFGMRVHPITGVRKLHDGTDIGAPCGTPVRAAAGGVVTSRGAAGGYGNRVVIDHGRFSTAYAHLSRFDVATGERVAAGEVVGRVGRTGYATGCHLHLMLVEGGRPVDPLPHV
ncbi:M23 family metallopeptidase [Aeromicrobium sp. Root495]|uniref:M23 family metallopeptidase n=1 Tax=Aeromicrobium sp. Root495 TaxID=1736550 RepID=UPI00138EE221|nr:M23 family metallopeptidase [Aeromicrobium sp. Root495]